MFGEIRWTEESEAHIARHNITPDEVLETIYTKPRYRADDGDLELIYGTTAAGRHLFVFSPKPSMGATSLSPPAT